MGLSSNPSRNALALRAFWSKAAFWGIQSKQGAAPDVCLIGGVCTDLRSSRAKMYLRTPISTLNELQLHPTILLDGEDPLPRPASCGPSGIRRHASFPFRLHRFIELSTRNPGPGPTARRSGTCLPLFPISHLTEIDHTSSFRHQ
jgi:hypothetical protein